MTKLQKAMMAVSGSTSLRNDSTDPKQLANLSQRNLLDCIAQELMNEHPGLCLDEGRILAHANQIRKGLKLPSVIGRQVPAGHFDSGSRFGFLDEPYRMEQYCQNLAANGHIVEHHSDKGMYRISEAIASECEEIVS